MARRTAGDCYAVLWIHEQGEVVPANFGFTGTEKVGLCMSTLEPNRRIHPHQTRLSTSRLYRSAESTPGYPAKTPTKNYTKGRKKRTIGGNSRRLNSLKVIKNAEFCAKSKSGVLPIVTSRNKRIAAHPNPPAATRIFRHATQCYTSSPITPVSEAAPRLHYFQIPICH
jgi:hypothetical protein